MHMPSDACFTIGEAHRSYSLGRAFLLLEYLYIQPLTMPDTHWSLPSTFRVPLLHHLVLLSFSLPITLPLPVYRGSSRSLLNIFNHPRTPAQENYYISFHSCFDLRLSVSEDQL